MRGWKCRVAMYSPGMVGFGHIRRNASIAQALRCSSLQPVIIMVAEARQAAALPMPQGVDSVTLPALRKEADGWVKPRFLDVSDQDLIALRARVIKSAIKSFEPDVLIVDHLPRGAGRELARTLERLRRHGNTRCVLGLRDVLQDPKTVDSNWSDQGNGTPYGIITMPSGFTAILPCTIPFASMAFSIKWRRRSTTLAISTSVPGSNSRGPRAPRCWQICRRANSRSVSSGADRTAPRWPKPLSGRSCRWIPWAWW